MCPEETKSSPTQTLKRLDVVKAAREYLKVKFCHQGRSKNGIDCVGVLECTAEDLGLLSRDDFNLLYSRRNSNRDLLTILDQHPILKKKKLSDMKPGDIIAMADKDNLTGHAGFVTWIEEQQSLGVLHAFFPSRKVVEHNIDGFWRGQIRGVYGLKAIEEGE
jgi:hypothetical protein